MKRRSIITCLLTVVATFILGTAPLYAQDDDPAVDASVATTGTVQITATDPLAIRALLEEPEAIPGGYQRYAAAIFWTVIFGALGGMVFELLRLRGYVALPHRYKPGRVPDADVFLLDGFLKPYSAIDLGVLGRMFVGAMAALAILLVISPAERMQFIASAVIAGSAGASVFDTLRARLTASLAVADAADVRSKSEQIDERLDEMAELITQLQQQSRNTAGIVNEAVHEFGAADQADLGEMPAPRSAAVVDSVTIDQLSRVLGEAKGIRTSMTRGRHSPPARESDHQEEQDGD